MLIVSILCLVQFLVPKLGVTRTSKGAINGLYEAGLTAQNRMKLE